MLDVTGGRTVKILISGEQGEGKSTTVAMLKSALTVAPEMAKKSFTIHDGEDTFGRGRRRPHDAHIEIVTEYAHVTAAREKVLEAALELAKAPCTEAESLWWGNLEHAVTVYEEALAHQKGLAGG
jgi:hypothetical protein